MDKFIRSNFSMAQLRLVSQAKYNRRTGLATVPVQPGEENILDAARLDNSLVDLTKLTKRDFEEDREETEGYKGPQNKDPTSYRFDSAQSVTTIMHGAEKLKLPSSGKTVKSVAFGESVCSIKTIESEGDEEDDGNAATLALDPITKLRNEEVQFDLTFLGEQDERNASEEPGMMEVDDDARSVDDDSVATSECEKSETTKILATQRRTAATDAALAAATVGLDLTSVASETDNAELSLAIVLAGDGRSFQEMFDILDSLLEESLLSSDEKEMESICAWNNHVPADIRNLLSAEATANKESGFDLVTRIRNWLRQAEDEEAEEAGEERYREREYNNDGSILPRPEDYGDVEPQGCGDSSTATRTDSAMASQSTDSSTARLGASTK